MKQGFIYLTLVFIASLIVSCSDDGEGKTPGGKEVKFEVTGNFSGQLSTTYITASGGGTSESINSLPWTKTVTYETSVPSTGMSVVGISGVVGETLAITVFVNGKQVSSTPGAADNNGTVAVTAPSHIF
jgi:hypothetical protein